MTTLAASVGRITGGATRRLDRLTDGQFAAVAFLPGALLVGLIVIPPIITVFGMSLFRIEFVKDPATPFIGLGNFERILRDDDFLASVPRTIVLAAGLTLLSVPLALGTALLLNRAFRGSTLLGVAVLIPYAIAPVVTGQFWGFIFNSHFGILTGIATALGLVDGPVRWLDDTRLAMVVAVIAAAWRSMPILALILLASLKIIPEALYRAAKMDGATTWQSFRFVTLPAIRNTLLVVIILAILTSLQIFDILFTLTKGGPGRDTTVIPYYIYLRAFQNLSLGYSAALAVFLFALICFFSAFAIFLRLRSTERRAPVEAEVDEAVAVAISAARRPSAGRAGVVAGPAAREEPPADEPTTRRGDRLPSWVGPVARSSLLIALLVWLVAPVLWIVIASSQTEMAMTQTPPALSLNLDLGWYGYLLSHPKWQGSLIVSITVALLTTLITIVIGALTAYPLARLRIPLRNVFMGVLVFTQMVPAIVMAIPVLLLFQALHLRDSVIGLVLINVAFLLPLVIWLERGYFEDVPKSIEAAARIDGCSRLGTLFRITMPAAAPGIFAIAIVLLIGTWNEFLFAVVLGDKDAVTVTRRITDLGSLNPQFGVAYTQLAAAGVLAVLPPLVLVLLFNRRIVRGLTEGFVKG